MRKQKRFVRILALLVIVVLAVYVYRTPRGFVPVVRCALYADSFLRCLQGEPVTFEADLFGMRYSGNSKNGIDSHILYYGAYEKPILYLLRDVAQRLSDPVFIDIGANTGQHSLFMSQYAVQVHAFDPYKPVIDRFKHLRAINHIDNITIHQVGLGAKQEEVTFFEPVEDNLGVGTVVAQVREHGQKETTIEIVKGDAFFKQHAISKVDVVKIDIEGYEKQALEGLSETVKKNRPVIVFELIILPQFKSGFSSLADMQSVFPEKYHFFRVVEKDIRAGTYTLLADGIQFTQTARFNVLAVPMEHLESLHLDF